VTGGVVNNTTNALSAAFPALPNRFQKSGRASLRLPVNTTSLSASRFAGISAVMNYANERPPSLGDRTILKMRSVMVRRPTAMLLASCL
jgi:hypothetical protein